MLGLVRVLLQRGQTNNKDGNILLRKMVAVIRNRNQCARERTGRWWFMPLLARPAEMSCGTDTKGLKSISWSRQD